MLTSSRLLTLVRARTIRGVAMTDVHRLAPLGFEYLQALLVVSEVHLTRLRPSEVLGQRHKLAADFHTFLTTCPPPSDSKRALPSALLRHACCQDADCV